ncbi:MAG: hypothetical protein Q9227_006083 [Pyrenula ochraceoflavens]
MPPPVPSPFTLTGRSCLITGGSSGIGLATARRFLELNARSVTIVGRNEDKLREAEKLLNSHKTSDDQDVNIIDGDISNKDFWFETWKGKSAMNEVDTLVNSAAVPQQSLLTYTHTDAIEQLLSVNLAGTIFTSKAFIRSYMRARFTYQRRASNAAAPNESPSPSSSQPPASIPLPTGVIINMSSLLAEKRGAGSTVYAASKAGILGFTRALAHEMSLRDRGRGAGGSGVAVRVNAVVPGYVDTPMLHDLTTRTKLTDSIPMGRLGTAQEVADAVAFLVCNEYAHNTVLNLDGGLSST